MRFNYLAGACLASVVFLDACSGGSGVPPTSAVLLPSSSQTRVADSVGPSACARAKIFVADFVKSDVEIYSQGVSNPRPCGKITTGVRGPEAIYVDAKGTLYVANFSTSTVTEYLAGKRTPSFTITTAAPGYDIFVGSDKTLYVAEATANTVAEYAPGATTPTLSISINGGPHGVATDKQNNLYVSYLSDSDGVSHVEKFAPKATTGTDLGFTVSFSGEVKLDSSNDVVIGDRNNNDIVYVYPPGQTVPSRSFATAGGNPINFALNKAETLFYVSGFNAVEVIDYQTGVQVNGITSGLTSPSGVAAYPPAPY
jgi:hypothetical protein